MQRRGAQFVLAAGAYLWSQRDRPGIRRQQFTSNTKLTVDAK
jgi:hypothetical protein